MKTKTLLLVILSLPIVLLWVHMILLVSITVNGLIRVMIGFVMLTIIWLLKRHGDIDYIISIIAAFLIAGISAQLGIGVLIESFTLVLPLFLVFLLFHYKHNVILLFLTPTVIYVYTLFASYAASIGLSYRSMLASLPIIVSIGRLVVEGKTPITVIYEPIPGLTILYAASIIALIILLIDLNGIGEAGLPAFEESVRIFFIAVSVSLVSVYVVLLFSRTYIILWSMVTTAIFIMSYLAYRLLARDTS